MSRQVQSVCAASLLILALLLVAVPVAQAAEPADRVLPGYGILAVQEEGKAWRILAAGDALPARCMVASAATFPCRIEAAEGASLHVAPGSRFEWNGAERSVSLDSGRVFLETASAPWLLSAAGTATRLEADASAELAVDQGRSLTLAVTRGRASLARPGAAAALVEEKELAAWNSIEQKLSKGSLPPEEAKRIESWTADVPPAQGLGQLFIGDAQSESPIRLNLARYHVHVVLHPPVALVQIDQSFYNPHSGQQEGTFVFNLPEQASVSRFAMYVTADRLIEGELIERQEANRVYDSIVRRLWDPAILEQIGDNLFKMRVFPVPSRDTKRILLDYTVPLEELDGRYQFQLPLLSDLEPIWDFRVSGAILGGARANSVVCDSHPDIAFDQRADGAITFDTSRTDYRSETNLVLRFAREVPERGMLRSYLAEPLLQGTIPRRSDVESNLYFQASLYPQGHGDPRTGPADVLIVADTSGASGHLSQLRPAVETVLNSLRPEDRFRLACLDVSGRLLGGEWAAPGSAAAYEAQQEFDAQFCLGGADLAVGVRDVLRAFADSPHERRRLVIYVGSGRETLNDRPGELSERLITSLAEARASWIAVLVGREPAKTVQETVARHVGGLVFDAAGGRRGYEGLFHWLLSGLPTPERIVAVDAVGVADEDFFCPATAWLPGQPLNLFGRTSPGNSLRVSLTTLRNGQPQTEEWNLPINHRRDDVFVGRLWAQQKLDRLLAQQTAAPQLPQQLRQQVVSLSKEWSLLSPHTAFLVLESEEDYPRWGIDRQQRRRYWRPADALATSPISPEWLARMTPAQRPRELPLKEVVSRATQALEAGNASLANRVLERAATRAAAESPEYQQLKEQVLRALRREALLASLGARRSLVEPARLGLAFEQSPSLDALLSAGINRDFLKRHPLAPQLLREVTLPTGDFKLTDLVKTLQVLTGKNVTVDAPALAESGLHDNSPLDVIGFGRLPLRDYARFALRQLELGLKELPEGLWITTMDRLDLDLSTEIYPVADLLLEDRMPGAEQLPHPYLDRAEQARERIARKLQRPLTLRLRGEPLSDVLRRYSEELGEPLLLDRNALLEASVRPDAPVTASWRDVPMKDSLRSVLAAHALAWRIDGSALVVTTWDEADEHHAPRLYSASGIVYEHPTGAAALRRRPAFLGGFGFAGGGFGGGGFGGVGGFGDEPAEMPEGVGISSWSDADSPGSIAPFESPLSLVVSQSQEVQEPTPGTWFEPSEERFPIDYGSMVDLVTATVAPTTWDAVGGPSSIGFFEPTLDFVITAPDHVHAEIETFFSRLRDLPPILGDFRAARPRGARADNPEAIDPDRFTNLITSVVAPTSWDQVGGPSSVAFDLPRLALIVSANLDAQDAVEELLIGLRRSKYAGRTGRAWDPLSLTDQPSIALRLLHGAAADEVRLAELPEPRPEELAALAVRRETSSGGWEWRAARPKAEPQILSLRREDVRLEAELPGCRMRLEGDGAMLAYPGLRLAEQGPWGEALRQCLDARLPWFPHRSNAELARLFEVRQVPANEEDSRRQITRLRFIFPGYGEASGNYPEAAFSREHGLPIAWEAYADGQLASRLRFDRRSGDESATWQSIRLEDAAGREHARWELVEEADPRPIDALDVAPAGYVTIRTMPGGPEQFSPLERGLVSLRKSDWETAAGQFREALDTHPEHPLLLLLWAWCCEHDHRIAPRGELLEALAKIARSGSGALLELVESSRFSRLQPSERYQILSQQPAEAREAGDWERLARAAAEASHLAEALGHVEKALQAPDQPADFDRQLLRVELLARLGRSEDAAAAAKAWAARDGSTPGRLERMAELLGRHGQRPAADRLLEQALAAEGLPGERRHQLLVQRAALHEGQPRWRLLIAAGEALPADSGKRKEQWNALLAELTRVEHAEPAARLAAETSDRSLRVRLLLRQAELVRDPVLASELCWKLYQQGELPEERLGWVVHLWNHAGQPQQVIALLEARLRQPDKKLSTADLYELQVAYHAAGRLDDAIRAASHPRLAVTPGAR